jgi:hypothetical protein
VMTRDNTPAKIGRSMKKREMFTVVFLLGRRELRGDFRARAHAL